MHTPICANNFQSPSPNFYSVVHSDVQLKYALVNHSIMLLQVMNTTSVQLTLMVIKMFQQMTQVSYLLELQFHVTNYAKILLMKTQTTRNAKQVIVCMVEYLHSIILTSCSTHVCTSYRITMSKNVFSHGPNES